MEELQQAPAGKFYREENTGENSAVQTTSPQAVDSGRNSTISDESDKPRGGGETDLKKRTVKKRSPTTLQETQNLQKTHVSMKSRKRELRPESGNSPYRIKSWLTQLSQNNKQNSWLITSQDPLDGWGPGQTASRSRQPIQTPFCEKNLKAKIFLQQVNNKIANATKGV